MVRSLVCDDEDAAQLATRDKCLLCVPGRGGTVGETACSSANRQGEIAGVRVRSIVDLLDVDGCVINFKKSSKRPNRSGRTESRRSIASS